MPLSDDARRRLVVATTSVEAGEEIASHLDGLTIDEPLTLYVETTGNDSNPGTQNLPFATPNAALNYVRKFEINSEVIIQLGVGTFDGFTLWGLSIGQNATTASRLLIKGTLVSELAGTCTATVSSGVTILTDASKSWTTNEHAGKIVTGTTSGGVSSDFVCLGNTATELYVSTNAATSTSYTIQTLGTVIAATTRMGVSGSIFVGTNPVMGSSGNILVQYVRCTGVAQMRGNVTFTSCQFTGGFSFFNGIVTANHCSFTASTGLGHGTSGSPGLITVSGGHFSSTTAGIAWNGPSQLALFGTIGFLNCATGLSVSGGKVTANNSAAGYRFVGCTTAVHCTFGHSLLSATTTGTGALLTGTGNTTAIRVEKGSRVQVAAASNIAGTTEINVDGTTTTLAAMRALTPKAFPSTPNAFGSCVFE